MWVLRWRNAIAFPVSTPRRHFALCGVTMSEEGMKANGHGIIWTKFYFRDWLAEPSLRRLGPEHRGVWIDMLCLMATGESYGRLETDGKPWPTSELARCLGVAQVLLEQLLEQMERVGVFSKDENGVIFSRRMLRDMDLYNKRAKAGSIGGKAARSESEKKNPEARARATVCSTFAQAKQRDSGTPTLNPALKGQDAAAAALSPFLQLVRQVQTARNDWSLNEAHVGQELRACPDQIALAKAVREFAADACNGDKPRNPIGMLRGYIRKAMAPDAKATDHKAELKRLRDEAAKEGRVV